LTSRALRLGALSLSLLSATAYCEESNRPSCQTTFDCTLLTTVRIGNHLKALQITSRSQKFDKS